MYRGVLPAALFFRIFVSTGSPNDRTSGRKNREHGKIDPQFRPDRRRRLPDIGTRNDARRRVVAQTAILRTPAQRILAHHGRTLRTGTSGRVPASESYAAGDANRALGRLPPVRARRQPRQQHQQRRTEPHRGTATAQIRTIAFNGQYAARLFKRYFPNVDPEITRIILPSTSPAHAVPLEKKLQAWQAVKDFLK